MRNIGAHMLLYSPEADALRATLWDVFGFEDVDAGDGWLSMPSPRRAGWRGAPSPPQTVRLLPEGAVERWCGSTC